MADLKSAKCKYCKMTYRYRPDSWEVICPYCKKQITTPTGTKRDIELGLNLLAKAIHIFFH